MLCYSSFTCVDRYVYDYYSAQYKPTVGVEYHSKSLSIDGTDFKLSFWDIVGVDKAGSVAKVQSYLKSDSYERIKRCHCNFDVRFLLVESTSLFV